MCGRFSLVVPERFFSRVFVFKDLPEMQPAYNIPPGVDIWAVKNRESTGEPTVARLSWGLVPSWAKDPKIGYRMINARSETACDKPAFRSAFKQGRCVIPADGFYEWRRNEKTKMPFHIHLHEHEPFAMAGLWETWKGPEGGELHSCTILTTAPNNLMESIHDRMPVILPWEAVAAWLAPDTSIDELKSLLLPYPADNMEAYPVSPLVNNPRNNRPECLKRFNPPKQGELF